MSMKPPRLPWNGFPDVLIQTDESSVKQHPDYWAAKTGDATAALRLVQAVLNRHQLAVLKEIVGSDAGPAGNAPPILASVHAYERDGVNAIPEVLADELSASLGWPVDDGIVQTNVVSHTGADGFSRLARQAEFSGTIKPGARYVMVDDFVGMGGTLANLRGHIESNGGRAVAAIVLTGKQHSAKLRLSLERLAELRSKHGKELEHWWQERFGHAFDALTESEARYLVRTPDADTLRDRLAAAE